jgi:hypothetical protein
MEKRKDVVDIPSQYLKNFHCFSNELDLDSLSQKIIKNAAIISSADRYNTINTIHCTKFADLVIVPERRLLVAAPDYCVH